MKKQEKPCFLILTAKLYLTRIAKCVKYGQIKIKHITNKADVNAAYLAVRLPEPCINYNWSIPIGSGRNWPKYTSWRTPKHFTSEKLSLSIKRPQSWRSDCRSNFSRTPLRVVFRKSHPENKVHLLHKEMSFRTGIDTRFCDYRIAARYINLGPRGWFTITLQIRPHGSFQNRPLLKDSTSSRMA